MKRIIYTPLLLLAVLLGSCVNYNDVTEPVTVQVQLVKPDNFTEGSNASDLSGHDITLTVGSKAITLQTDENGLAIFQDVIPNVYDISSSWKITGEDYSDATGIECNARRCTVSGSLSHQLIKGLVVHYELRTQASIDRDIIISKIASAACKDGNNRSYMAGKYLELYNNADEAVDIAGLYIGLLDSDNPQPYTLENLQEVYDGAYVLIKQIFRIPTDKPFMVEPGGTVLLTNSAVDHSDVSELESDLSGADFEAKDASGSYVNNPKVPALLNAFSRTSGSSIMNLVQGGPCGIVIFRTDEDVTQYGRTYAYGKTSGSQWLLLPVDIILDGVDYLKKWNDGIRVGTKRLPAIVDAGYTHINAINGWTGEVVYRRTESHATDGHAVLMDTNNSINDFQVSTTIKPREYDE